MSIRKTTLRLEVARAFKPLLFPRRYKGACGGKGGGKSHFFAGELLRRCAGARLRCVCVSEARDPAGDAVRRLLIERIGALGLASFTVHESGIRAKNGSLIVFVDMASCSPQTFASLAGCDIAWADDAQTLSENSFRLLRAALRKPGSELWFSWTPRHATDAVDRFFRGGERRDDAVLATVGWRDNPWFPEALAREKAADHARDPITAEHVWGGAYAPAGEAVPELRPVMRALHHRDESTFQFRYPMALRYVPSRLLSGHPPRAGPAPSCGLSPSRSRGFASAEQGRPPSPAGGRRGS
ncbi:MAG: phage terminase large subunit [Parvibaculaceae bacterium]